MPESSAPRLLVIDDDPKLAGVVAAVARDAFPDPLSLVIETAHSAEAADVALRRLEAAGASRLVVISDFHLPPSHLHGVHLLMEARRRLPSAKRVLMTGRDPSELAGILEGADLDAFVEKPFTFDEMRRLIVRLVAETAVPGAGTAVPVRGPGPSRGGLEAASAGERA